MDEPKSTADFRKRLEAIPKMGDRPVRDDWSNAAPPIVRQPAPVVRQPGPAARPVAPVARRVAPVARPAVPVVEEELPAAQRNSTNPPTPGQRVVREQSRPTTPREIVFAPTRRRRRWPIFAFLLLSIVAFILIIPLFLANRTFNSVERVSLGEALVEPLADGTNILLVGTDSRDGIDSDTENAEVILGEGISGARTDTMMILRVEEEGSKFLSLPRDLWLPIDGGDPQRINVAFARGPDALVNTVRLELGIPISHYAEVDLAGFIDLVDAVDGVTITIPHPAFDRNSGLDLPVAGEVALDSRQALAYVRSRFYTEIVDGAEVRDPTSDLGRVQRQQIFMRALLEKVSAQRNPATLNAMSRSIAAALVIDDDTTLTGALALANTLRTASPVTVTLPTTPETIDGAAVLTMTNEAPAVLAQFGG